MTSEVYHAQVDLLIRLLPSINTEPAFALKGGTAINLFVREMPRLSVDIDLTYVLFDDREIALKNISEALGRIKINLEKQINGIKISQTSQNGQDTKLICESNRAQVIIEVNTIMRGHLFPTRTLQLSQKTQNQFHKFAAINVMSHGELFGGKICAALDRQHPRDLFDVRYLLDAQGFSNEVRLGFIAALLSHPRPIHEVLSPNFSDQRQSFTTQFSGMTDILFEYENFELTRKELVITIDELLTASERSFLMSFKKGTPDWASIPLDRLKDMPAVQWKLQNVQNLHDKNPEKHIQQLNKLEKTLYTR